MIIKTTDGDTYCADHVIVTISLGVLEKKYNTRFHPPLPEKKSRLYRFVRFSKKFGNKNIHNHILTQATILGTRIWKSRKNFRLLQKTFLGTFFFLHTPWV